MIAATWHISTIVPEVMIVGTVEDADRLLSWTYEKVGDDPHEVVNLNDAERELEWEERRAISAYTYLANRDLIRSVSSGGAYSITVCGIDQMEALEGENMDRWADRWAFLKLSYERANGDMHELLNMWETGEELGWDRPKTSKIHEYLREKGLLEAGTIGGGYRISDACIDLIECAHADPDSPTAQMPPLSSLQVHITNSFNDTKLINTIIASPGAVVHSGEVDMTAEPSREELIQAFSIIREAISTSDDLDSAVKSGLVIDVDTCIREVEREQPDKTIIARFWDRVKALPWTALQAAAVASATGVVQRYLQ